MLFSFLSLSCASKLGIRKRKSQCDRVTKRTLKIYADDRGKRFEEVLTVEHFLRDVVSDCVDAVVEMLSEENEHKESKSEEEMEESKYEEKKEEIKYEEEKEEVAVDKPFVKVKSKRVSLMKRTCPWYTWLKRCYVIYMYLPTMIFNQNMEKTCVMLGIPRSTLLGWVSRNVKTNCVAKWFDIVSQITWGDVKNHVSSQITGSFDHIEENSKVDLSKWKMLRSENVVLSKFCGIPPSKRAKLGRSCSNARAKGVNSVVGSFSVVKMNDKLQLRNRSSKFPGMFKKISDFVIIG